MGGFSTGFLQGFTNAAQQKIDQRHAEHQQQQEALRAGLWKIAYGPEGMQPGMEAARLKAQKDLQGMYGPEGKKGLQKFGELFNRITGHGQQAQTDPSQQPQAQPSPRGALQGPAPVNLATPSTFPGGQSQPQAAPAAQQTAQVAQPSPHGRLAAPQFQLPPAPTDAQIDQARDREGQAGRERRKALADEAGMKGASRVEFIESGKVSPSLEKPSVMQSLTEAIKASDPDLTDADAAKQAGELIKKQAEAKSAPKESNKKQVWMKYPDDPPGSAGHAVWVDPKDPSKRTDASTNGPVPEGAEIVNEAALAAQIRGDSYSQAARYATAFRKAGYSEEDASRLGGQLALTEAERRIALIGAGSTHEAMGINAAGQSVAIPLQSHRTPNALPGIPPPPAAGQPQSATPQAAPQTQPQRTPAPAQNTAPVANATPASPRPQSVGSRPLDAVSAATAKQAAQISVPLTESVTQIFGDPNQPDLKPMASFAKLADDPKAKERLGKAIQLTLDGLGEGVGEASIGGGAGPIHVSAGGFGEWLQQRLNVPGAIASERAKNMRQAIDALTPEEKEAYNATMSEMSTMAGLRTLSRASAALGSIRMIEREMPKIGLNVQNSRDFYDQLQKVGSAVANAVNTPGLLPKVTQNGQSVPVGITPEMYNRLRGLSAELQKRKDASGPSPKGKLNGPQLKAPKVGDIEDGYRFKGGDPHKQENWEKVRAAA